MLVQENQVHKSRQAGFTMVELMVTIAIIGIVAALAAPSFQANRDQIAVERTANAFVSALTLARSTALSTRQEALVCFSVNALSCSNAAGQPASWVVEARNRANVTQTGGFQSQTLLAFSNPNPDVQITCLPGGQTQFVYFDQMYTADSNINNVSALQEFERSARNVNGPVTCTVSINRAGATQIQDTVLINSTGLATKG